MDVPFFLRNQYLFIIDITIYTPYIVNTVVLRRYVKFSQVRIYHSVHGRLKRSILYKTGQVNQYLFN